MMTNKEFVLEHMRRYGKLTAQNLQKEAPNMTGTELYNEGMYIPSFAVACNRKNMLDRPVGFVCISAAGRVVKLLQPYDSTIYTQEPEELPAQWGFVWSNNPEHAREYVAMSTSPYMKDNVCLENGKVYRSTIDNNVWAPSAYPQGWEEVISE
jgi:hypothetical protein